MFSLKNSKLTPQAKNYKTRCSQVTSHPVLLGT